MLWLSAAATSGSSSGVAIIAIIAGAIVGVVGPLLNGRYQRTTTEKSIAAERERLAETLAGEDHRLEQRLSFERGETDRRELREILDALAERMWSIDEAYGSLNAVAQNLLEDPRPPVDGYWQERVTTLSDRIEKDRDALGDQIERLRLRLRADGDRMIEQATLLYVHSGQSFAIADSRVDAEVVEMIGSRRSAVHDYRRKFIAEALKFTEARLHKPPEAKPTAEQKRKAATTPTSAA